MNDRECNIWRRLDQQQFDKAIEILSEEQTANRPSRAQRIFYRLLTIAAYGATIMYAVLIAGIFILHLGAGHYDPWYAVLKAFLIGSAILFFSVPMLVLLNISLLRKVLRQARLIRRLNLRELYATTWRSQKKKRRWMRLFSWLIVLVGALVVVSAFSRLHGVGEVLFSLIFGLSMIGAYFIWLCKNKMDMMMNVESLKQALVQYRTAAEADKKDFIAVPFDQIAQIARIEGNQIARQRAAAIDGMKEAVGTGYTSRRARSFQESAARIRDVDRLAVEQQIEGLMSDPRPVDAVPADDRGTLVLNIPGTSYALTYVVDDSQRQIDLLALQPSAGDAPHNDMMKG